MEGTEQGTGEPGAVTSGILSLPSLGSGFPGGRMKGMAIVIFCRPGRR